MQVWPQNGWFVGLRSVLFARPVRKRTLAGVFIVLALVGTAEWLIRPDPARIEQEEYDVLSAYIFRVPLYSRQLPVQCAEDPIYTGGDAIAEIHQYFVSAQSLSASSQPSIFSHLLERKIVAPEVPIPVLNNFLLRNLSAAQFTHKFSGVNSTKLTVVHTRPDLSGRQQPTLFATFTKVGFNRDFTRAMLYAEVSCGEVSGREYAYLAKARYRGWYWYVYRVDRQ